jgi:citrate lyase subunit beta/citryl-CoA lyase
MNDALSWLFVPGNSARKIERALQGPAHALIFDWEDAVAPAEKAGARLTTIEALASAEPPLERYWIRINAIDSPHFNDDIASLPACAIAGVVLPKACGVDAVERLGHALDSVEARAALPSGTLKIVAIVTESAASVLALSEYRRPVPRLTAMMWGAEDLAADLGVMNNRDESGGYKAPFSLARNMMLLAAAAAQCVAIDAVFTDFRAHDTLIAESLRARADGFTAKAAIHPDQIIPINRAFAATDDERAWAEQVVRTLGDSGVAVMDGKMLDAPHLRIARRILARFFP